MSETTKRIARIRKLLEKIKEVEDPNAALNLERAIGEELGQLIPARISTGVLLSILFPRAFFEKDETQLVIDFLKEELDANHKKHSVDVEGSAETRNSVL